MVALFDLEVRCRSGGQRTVSRMAPERIAAGDYRLEGKTVIVTGAGSHIGRAIARAFAEQGCNLVLAGRREDALAETAEGMHADHVIAVPTDMQDRESVADLVAIAVDRFGSLDVVVGNAAAYSAGPIEELGPDEYRAMVATNVDGAVYLAQESIPHLSAGASIIFTTSVSAIRGDWGQAVYNATKGAMTMLMQSLALDLGARGIRVNAVAPAFTPSGGLADRIAADASFAEPFVNRVALGRVGAPEDVAPAFLFLASDDARYITGVTLPVDGGTSASTGQAHA
jgi:meso-butanediol dehydrogenase / (S,S)-butanediol dehydrogenase / diacetyl reductase